MFERAPVQRFDLLDGNPGIDQLTAVGGPQIQLPSPARIGGGVDLMRTLQAQCGEDQGAVARHGPWIVLNAAPQVQGRIRATAVSADARGKGMADAAGPQVVRKEQSWDAHTTRSRTTALR